jgi:ParE toxin of type II toxin-antitoxin system, parDE
MAFRLAKRAEADLEDIAYYIAKESGSLVTARRVIESITDRIHMLAQIPTPAAPATRIWAQAAEAFRPTATSSFTASPARTCLSCAWLTAAGTSRRYSDIERGWGDHRHLASLNWGPFDLLSAAGQRHPSR